MGKFILGTIYFAIWFAANAWVWPIVGDLWDANGFVGVVAGVAVCLVNLIGGFYAICEITDDGRAI